MSSDIKDKLVAFGAILFCAACLSAFTVYCVVTKSTSGVTAAKDRIVVKGVADQAAELK